MWDVGRDLFHVFEMRLFGNKCSRSIVSTRSLALVICLGRKLILQLYFKHFTSKLAKSNASSILISLIHHSQVSSPKTFKAHAKNRSYLSQYLVMTLTNLRLPPTKTKTIPLFSSHFLPLIHHHPYQPLLMHHTFFINCV